MALPNDPKKISVLLVDDHVLMRQGARVILERDPEIRVVGEAGNAQDAVRSARSARPDVVLLDIRLSGSSGIDAAKMLKKEVPSAKIIVLTGYDYDQYVRAFTSIGISGYLLKESNADELISAVRTVYRGGAVLHPSVASKVLGVLKADVQRPIEMLSLRELEVLEFLRDELSNGEIAHRMGVSFRTVEGHVSNILTKLGVTTRQEAVTIAQQEDLTGRRG